MRVLFHSLMVSLGLVLALPVARADNTPAPEFSIASETGPISLSEHKGKVVYLDFWASWCGPCRASFKWLNEAQERYGSQGLVVIAVNVDKDKEAARQFLKENPVNFKIGFDPEGGVAKSYQVRGMPSSYLIGRDGKLQSAHIGYRLKDKSELEDEVRKLVSEAKLAAVNP
ncbi:MAG: TlpA family protein disulfide reductase [Gallionella sp.]|nr:TlpA family protein disulfide reductase [Gallionella sp.]MDH4286595.1 TlpA family protein disulfide reductase [Gallionella sp.]